MLFAHVRQVRKTAANGVELGVRQALFKQIKLDTLELCVHKFVEVPTELHMLFIQIT